MFRAKGSSVCCLYLVYFLMLLDLVTSSTETYGSPSSDFYKYSIVRPKLRQGRTKRDITTTKYSTGLHHTEVTLNLIIDGKDLELELRLNEDLVPRGHTLSYEQGGEIKEHTPDKEELDICQYSGHVRGKVGSWAAVSTCRGVRGVIYDGDSMRYIEPQDDDVNGDHYLYSHEQLTTQHRCGHENDTKHNFNDSKQRSKESTQKWSKINRYKRHTPEDTSVREPYNVNSHTRYVELVLVVDHEEFTRSGSDLRRVHHHMKDLANIINSVYAPLNIFIALVGVEVWSHHDKISISQDSDNTLKQFARYRETELVGRIPNDNAHLLTRQKFSNSVVGKALIGVMCSKKSSAGIATNHSPVLGLVAMTIAHEMGHNFGMDHDKKEDCKCLSRKCIMSPVSDSITPLHWSSCSLRSLSLSFEKGMDYCLRNKPKKLLVSPTCGNGFLEEGEECDCGTVAGESAPKESDRGACQRCCKPDCTLRANATCGHGQCCDLMTCHYKPVATECRPTQRDCDLPEFCTGDSQFCPQDLHKMDTTPCGKQEGYCMQGSCRSHGGQCRLLWGLSGSDADRKCYMENARGDQYGNCGYDQFGMYKPCSLQDVKCGLLQCRHYNNKLEYGLETAVIGSTYPTYNGNLINPCRSVFTGLGGSSDDPGMVPDGAKCGADKMCINQKCQSVERVRAQLARDGSACPSDCSGHGVCNSNGNCHCEPGFAPPLCDQPGPGGSYDSGPATDLSGLRIFMIVMYVIFLGIIPAIVLVLLLIYFICPNALARWKRPDESYIRKLSHGTHKINVKFSTFGKWVHNGNTNKGINDCKTSHVSIPSKFAADETPASKTCNTLKSKCVEEVNLANLIRPSINVASTTKSNRSNEIYNNKDITSPIGFKHKLNEADIVIVESYIKASNKFNVDAKPKVDVTRKKFESPDNPIYGNTANINGVNTPKVKVVRNNFEARTDRENPISNSPVIPTSNVTSNQSAHSKASIKLQIDDKPKLSSKISSVASVNKLTTGTTNTNVSSTNNDLANQRSKLRKVTERDLTK